MDKGEHYDRALVPEHLTGLTIENLPLDEAFFIFPGENNGYDTPTVFVGPGRELMINSECDIDMGTNKPGTPVGRVGIMRTMVINPGTNEVTEHVIADLRFVEWHSLMHIDNSSQDMSDQESFMIVVDFVADSTAVDAFIAPDKDFDFEKSKKIPEGTFFGPPELYPNLEALQKRGSKLMKKVLDRRVSNKSKVTESPEPVVTIEERKNRAGEFTKRVLKSGSDTTTKTKKAKKTKEKPSDTDKPDEPIQDLSIKFTGPPIS